jgi:ATP-dependent phosphofructokinase / diphosphate-dependent phosphofructokinase
MRIGILTGGGDCPGLNAVIRAVVQRAVKTYDWDVCGIRHGWRGLLVDEIDPLDLSKVSGILPRGGTILGTSRTNPFQEADGPERIRAALQANGIDALVAIGGEDTLGTASKLARDGLSVVGVPKTIDNDVNGTDLTFGFDTALSIATEAIDRLHTNRRRRRPHPDPGISGHLLGGDGGRAAAP